MNLLAKITSDGELSGQAWLVLAGMILLIVGGLSWCLFRAVTAANKEPEEQIPDEL